MGNKVKSEGKPVINLTMRTPILPDAPPTENEPPAVVNLPAVVVPPVNLTENEPPAELSIEMPTLPPGNPLKDEEVQRLAGLFADGTWMPAADPLVIGPQNYASMQNLRFGERCLEGVPGYTKLNAATALAAYPKIRSGIQLQAPFTTRSRVLVQAYNAGLSASQVLQNKTAIPNQGDFEATALHTDAAGAGPGRFSKWPGNQIAYCNGKESKIYGGDEIPCAAFLNFDSANTYLYDYTEKVRNSNINEVATFAADTGGGGSDSDTAANLHLDDNVTDSSLTVQIAFSTGAHEPVVGETVHQATTEATGVVSSVSVTSGTWAGSDAAGTIFLTSPTGTWTGGNNMEDSDDTVIASCTTVTMGHTVTNHNVTFADTAPNVGPKWGKIAWFDGTTAYLTIPDHPRFDKSGGIWTHDLWVEPYGNYGGIIAPLYYQETPVTKVIYDTGAHEPTVGETVHQDSGATGVVLSYDNTGGWAGAGTGTIWLGEVTGTWADSEAMHDAGATVANCVTCTTDKNFFKIEIDASLGAGGEIPRVVIRKYGVETTPVSAPGQTIVYGLDIDNPAWYHLEFSQSGDNWYIFVNGALVASQSNAIRAEHYTSDVYLGRDPYADKYYWGYMEEIRLSTVCRHTASFTVPVEPYTLIVVESGGMGLINVWIGSLRPIQGGKFYIQHANSKVAAAAAYYWNGSSEVAVSSLVDGTAAGGKTLNVTGGASISFGSTVGLAKPRYLKGYFLYFYRFSFTGIDTDTSIYMVTLDAPFQSVVDLWDGTPLLLSSCLRYKVATKSYEDFTAEVAEESQTAFADFAALATTEHILFGSPVPLVGFYIQMSSDAAKVNANPAAMTVAYCNGGAITAWPSVTGLSDETAADLKSMKQPGVVSFSPVTPGSEYKVSINGGPPQYYYRLTFSAALSAAVEAGYITGIAAPNPIHPYKFPFSFLGRPMLCGYLEGNEGNRVDYGMKDTFAFFNGPDASNGVENESLYIGGSDELTAAVEVYNRLGSSIYSFAIFTKNYETYILNGYDAETYRIFTVSAATGCPAPFTMDTYQIAGSTNDGQPAIRTVAAWLSHTGPVMYDSGSLTPIPGLECYFDRRDSRCVNSAAIGNSRGWFDPDTGDYNLQFPSGTEQTVNNVWVALSWRYKKWYPVVPSAAASPYLGGAFRVADLNGRQYVYGARDNGYLMRIHDPAVATWDGTAAVQSVTFGDLLCSGNIWDRIRLLYFKLFGISITEDVDASLTHYADGATAGTALTVVALNGANRYFKDTQRLGLAVAWSHKITITATITTNPRGMRLLGWGMQYQIEREDL